MVPIVPEISTELEEPAGGAAKVPVLVMVWDAASLAEVKVIAPVEAFKLAVRLMLAATSALLMAVIELSWPAAVPSVSVVVAVPDVFKMIVSFLREFVALLVRSVAVPGTANAPAPVGASVARLAFGP